MKPMDPNPITPALDEIQREKRLLEIRHEAEIRGEVISFRLVTEMGYERTREATNI